ncbi:MAG: GAF domain-containing protein, partial [Cyclobacteriaceae bacterium]|nr:GAF domain-containing protein [Cyclobacteriaceae bacterium HetDA_MAG_MS6]
ENSEILTQHREFLDILMTAIIPPAVSEEQITALFTPFSMDYFYATPLFFDLIEKAGSLRNMVKSLKLEDIACKKTFAAYQAIMFQFYGIELAQETRIALTLEEENGLEKHYHLDFNSKFCETVIKGDLPKLSEDEIQELLENPEDLELWNSKLPPERFEFQGFGIYHLTEATEYEVISSVKESLLKKDSIINEDSFSYLEGKFRSLLEIPDLMLGISQFQLGRENFCTVGSASCRSLLADQNGNYLEPFHNLSHQLRTELKPVTIPDISKNHYFKGYEYMLTKPFISITLAPLHINEQFIGVLELASNIPGKQNAFNFNRMAEILPLFAMSLKRSTEELENKIQSIVKEHYTSIHPTVEWKFTEAANHILNQQETGQRVMAEEIVLKDVYPLYAVSDIRNSSVERNNAIIADLTEQLKLAKAVLTSAKSLVDFPLMGETSYRISKMISKLKKGLLSGDESSIVNFIKTEVEPLIKGLLADLPDLKPSADKYFEALDQDLKIVYHKRKSFEDSLTTINETISKYLEIEQGSAQKIFPHYFEKYKTDGVEYNMYVGQSITRQKNFSKMYLKNLRLWQLKTQVEVARKAFELKETLSLPLDTTHLILVHNQALSVKFRMDEKQFDVYGAYNMRYEIVKKRIDKVLIKDSDERLTQPNTIAIVYSQDEDAKEYLTYIEYLQHQGLLSPYTEKFELEELQGVIGLKALRVNVEMGTNKKMMEEVQKLAKSSPAVN